MGSYDMGSSNDPLLPGRKVMNHPIWTYLDHREGIHQSTSKGPSHGGGGAKTNSLRSSAESSGVSTCKWQVFPEIQHGAVDGQRFSNRLSRQNYPNFRFSWHMMQFML